MELTFEAIGTHWYITADIDGVRASDVEHAVRERIETFDKTYSRFRPDSLVTKMAQQAGAYELPADAYEMLKFYEQLYASTKGLVTPLIGQVMSDAGYDAGYSFQEKPLLPPPRWEEVITYSRERIALTRPALLDFGAAGKGYLVDIVAGVLDDASARAYVINAGGDIKHKNPDNDPLTVGLENPLNHAEVVGIVELRNQSICASSGSRRKWGQYTHIINPDTLVSPQDVQATWVVAESAMLADGLATALFFADPAKLRKQFDFSFAMLGSDMSLAYPRDFPVTINKA